MFWNPSIYVRFFRWGSRNERLNNPWINSSSSNKNNNNSSVSLHLPWSGMNMRTTRRVVTRRRFLKNALLWTDTADVSATLICARDGSLGFSKGANQWLVMTRRKRYKSALSTYGSLKNEFSIQTSEIMTVQAHHLTWFWFTAHIHNLVLSFSVN
jgi:hypothetical protein